MARQVTLEKRYLRTKLIKARKNLSKIKSHIKYLEECQVKKVIPRSLNLVNLAKSEELWKGNKKHIFDILTKGSENLFVETITRWRKEELLVKKQIEKTEDTLKEEFGEQESIRIIEEAIKISDKVLKTETENKQNKLVRDKLEKDELEKRLGKKRKNRRFRRRNNRNVVNNNNEEGANAATNEDIDGDNNDINVNSDQVRNRDCKVKNISSKDLTEHQQKLCELGPKFCIVDHDIDRARYQKDLNEGFRRMKIADHFYPDDDNRSEEEKRFYVKHSDWEPNVQNVNKSLLVHNNIIQHKFDRWKQPVRVASNMSKEMHNA